MARILCPFCDQEFELEKDLSGEYLCPTCEETVLYENNDLLEKPIVLGKYHDFFAINNIVGVIFLIVFSIFTFGIGALILLLAYVVSEVSNRREIQRRANSGHPYPEQIFAYGIRIDVDLKMKLLHWSEKKQLEFYPNELTSIKHMQRYHAGRFKLFTSILKRSGEFAPDKELKGSIKIFLNDSHAGSIIDVNMKKGEEICQVLQNLYGVAHSVERIAIAIVSEGGDGGGGGA
tara:strand:+ start:195 stop:893 length:699 start_codon:yes stop_codon:yes gene_type:complete